MLILFYKHKWMIYKWKEHERKSHIYLQYSTLWCQSYQQFFPGTPIHKNSPQNLHQNIVLDRFGKSLSFAPGLAFLALRYFSLQTRQRWLLVACSGLSSDEKRLKLDAHHDVSEMRLPNQGSK